MVTPNLQELQARVAALERHLKELNQIGASLSTEKNLDRLLEKILLKTREITAADSGSLYLIERSDQAEQIRFKLAQNDSVAATASFLIRPVYFVPGGYFSNGQFQLQLSGLAGKSYLFEASTNLSDWLSISTNIAPSDLFQLMDPRASNFPYRFYRAIEQP